MLKIVKVITQIIQKNRDAAAVSRMYQTEGDEPEDVQEIESIEQTGVQSRAPADSLGVVGRISAAYRVLIGHKDGVAPYALEEGERIAYAISGGAVACSIKYNADGSIDITVPSDANVIGNLNVDGNLDVTGNITAAGDISAVGDVVADSAGLGISLLDHFHSGNLGYPTDKSIMTGGGTAPGTKPTTDASGDIITGDNATSLDDHTHDYTWTDPAGNGTTDPPN